MTVAVPVPADVTKPEEVIVATLVGVMVQETDGLFVVLPSLLVPNTVICTVLPVVPVSMVGDDGPTAIEDSVGFTKKPVQATPMARIASVATTPIRRSLWFADDILVETPWARLLKPMAWAAQKIDLAMKQRSFAPPDSRGRLPLHYCYPYMIGPATSPPLR